jgi:hypothetical protein
MPVTTHAIRPRWFSSLVIAVFACLMLVLSACGSTNLASSATPTSACAHPVSLSRQPLCRDKLFIEPHGDD